MASEESDTVNICGFDGVRWKVIISLIMTDVEVK